MPDVNLTAVLRRIFASTVLAFSISSLPSHAASITVDGNLADIIAAVGTTNATNRGYGDDPLGSADSPTTEYENGFDIDKVYAYFNVATDTLYLGMSVYGTVGDSLPISDVTSTNEDALIDSSSPCSGFDCRNIFDSTENYGIQLHFGTSTSGPLLLSIAVLGDDNNTTDLLLTGSNPYGLGITYAVSEFFNGVELSISGLLASGAVPYIAQQDLLVVFAAGSSDLNDSSSLAEDSHNLQMKVVPVPAAAWLFGSGLLGLISIARRRRRMAS
jgi:hypothetical protein